MCTLRPCLLYRSASRRCKATSTSVALSCFARRRGRLRSGLAARPRLPQTVHADQRRAEEDLSRLETGALAEEPVVAFQHGKHALFRGRELSPISADRF